MKDAEKIAITPSSGNVFADLGLPDAEDLLAKANLALHIRCGLKPASSPRLKPPTCSASTSRKSP